MTFRQDGWFYILGFIVFLTARKLKSPTHSRSGFSLYFLCCFSCIYCYFLRQYCNECQTQWLTKCYVYYTVIIYILHFLPIWDTFYCNGKLQPRVPITDDFAGVIRDTGRHVFFSGIDNVQRFHFGT